jgi:ribosome-associated protein
MSTDAVPSLDRYIEAASEKKALNLIVLDVRDLTSIADVFIICSGRSNRQVNAIADSIVAKLKKHKIKPLIHVFYEPVREFFDLEGLWADAKRITTPAQKNLEM